MSLFATAYFPSLTYVAFAACESALQVEYQETFRKQTFRNRCTICSANGLLCLTVPIKRPQGNRSKTHEILIDYSQTWHKKHWRAIESAYRKSPFFEFYAPDIARVLQNPPSRLVDLNVATYAVLSQRLHLPAEIVPTTVFMHAHTIEDHYSPPTTPPLKQPDFTPYTQVFSDRYPFTPCVSALDLLFNLGPEAPQYLRNAISQKVQNQQHRCSP